MTDLERVEAVYDLILAMVASKKKVTVKTQYRCAVVFVYENEKYYAHTIKATAESEYLHAVYDLVKHEIADHAFGSDIEILVNDKLFVVVK